MRSLALRICNMDVCRHFWNPQNLAFRWYRLYMGMPCSFLIFYPQNYINHLRTSCVITVQFPKRIHKLFSEPHFSMFVFIMYRLIEWIYSGSRSHNKSQRKEVARTEDGRLESQTPLHVNWLFPQRHVSFAIMIVTGSCWSSHLYIIQSLKNHIRLCEKKQYSFQKRKMY
jgi:hypothetical protein